MDMHEMRLKNLEKLIKIHGSAAKIAGLIGSAPSVFSVIRSDKHPDKNMGNGMARRIETVLNLPHGWMEQKHLGNTAEQSIIEAGFKIAHTSSDTTSLNWSRWSRPDFIVTRAGVDLSVYVEIHPKTRLGIPISPDNTKSFVYISEDKTDQAGEILTEHFKKVLKGEFTDISYDSDPLGYDLVTPDLKDCFTLKVRSDSMLPTLSEGMLVYVRPQPDANSGDIVIAQVNGDTEATIKRLRKDGGQTYLMPDNDKYDSIKVTETLQCKIIGIVISARINFK